MKKILINVVKYLLFLGIGFILFWGIYGNLEWEQLRKALSEINYFWIVVSILLSILSQVSRAIRWNMLITPLGYKPRFMNTFLSVLVLYLVNLILPRAGEIGRCKVLSKYENIPFSKLVGTVFVERLADLFTLFIITIIIVASEFKKIFQIFDGDRITSVIDKINKKEVVSQGFFTPKNILLVIGIVVVLIFVLYELRKHRNSLKQKFIEVKNNVIEGIKTIRKLKNVWYFVGHTLFIFIMWLFMLYVIFLAYEPTKNLSLMVGATTFLMGGLAMLLPVQGGIGPWHLMVILTLSVYGLDIESGEIFALVAHTTTNLIYVLLGLLALLIMFLMHKKRSSLSKTE